MALSPCHVAKYLEATLAAAGFAVHVIDPIKVNLPVLVGRYTYLPAWSARSTEGQQGSPAVCVAAVLHEGDHFRFHMTMVTSFFHIPRSTASQWMPHLTKQSDTVPECCRRQAKAATSTKQRHHYSSYDGISYQFVDGSLMHRISTTVGGHRVVFGLAQVKLLRRKLDLSVALSPIEEEATTMCESCHSNAFSRLSKTKCITFSTVPLK